MTLGVGIKIAVGLELHFPRPSEGDHTPLDFGIRVEVGGRAGFNVGVGLSGTVETGDGNERESLRGLMLQEEASFAVVGVAAEQEIRSVDGEYQIIDNSGSVSGEVASSNVLDGVAPRYRVGPQIGVSGGMQARTGGTIREAFEAVASFFSGDQSNQDAAQDDQPVEARY